MEIIPECLQLSEEFRQKQILPVLRVVKSPGAALSADLEQSEIERRLKL
jgi:hypothetical protein